MQYSLLVADGRERENRISYNSDTLRITTLLVYIWVVALSSDSIAEIVVAACCAALAASHSRTICPNLLQEGQILTHTER
jgi:hypothetical protein